MANQVTEHVLLDTIIDGVTVIPSGRTSFLSALETMVNNGNQCTFYDVNKMIKTSEIEFKVDTDGKRYIDIELSKTEGDIVSHIDCNMKCELVIGNSIFDSDNRIVVTRCQYSPKFFRVFIDDKDTIFLFYRVTILNNLLRHHVLSVRTLVCDKIRYSGGIVINNF